MTGCQVHLQSPVNPQAFESITSPLGTPGTAQNLGTQDPTDEQVYLNHFSLGGPGKLFLDERMYTVL